MQFFRTLVYAAFYRLCRNTCYILNFLQCVLVDIFEPYDACLVRRQRIDVFHNFAVLQVCKRLAFGAFAVRQFLRKLAKLSLIAAGVINKGVFCNCYNVGRKDRPAVGLICVNRRITLRKTSYVKSSVRFSSCASFPKYSLHTDKRCV